MVVTGLLLGLGVISVILPSPEVQKPASNKDPSYTLAINNEYPNSSAFISDIFGFFQKVSAGRVGKRLWKFMGINCDGYVNADIAKQGLENPVFKKAYDMVGYCHKEIQDNRENKPNCDELETYLNGHNYLNN